MKNCVLVFILALAFIVTADEMLVKTNGKWENFPLQGTILRFKVQVSDNALIVLTGKLNPDLSQDPFYEILLGGWGNNQSVIRRQQEEPSKVVIQTPDLLSDHEFKGFWIKLVDSAVIVGIEEESIPIMTWKDPEPFTVTHFGLMTGFGSQGEWKIQNEGAGGGGMTTCAPEDILPHSSSDSGKQTHIVSDSCLRLLSGSCGLAVIDDGGKKKRKKYIINTELKTWDAAKRACESQGQHLASVRSKEEQTEISKAFLDSENPFSGVWIAAHDRSANGEFLWYDGSQKRVSFFNWEGGDRPNRDPNSDKSCVVVSYVTLVTRNEAFWYLKKCDDLWNFVCETYQ